MFFLTSCSNDAAEKENKPNVANRSLVAPSKLLKIVNNTPLTMAYTLTVSGDPTHDYQNLNNETYLTQEIKIAAGLTVVLQDFSSTYNQGLDVENDDKWYLTVNGASQPRISSSNANIDYGTYFNGVDNTDGYYCQWKTLKGGLSGNYASTDIFGFSSNSLSPLFPAGYNAALNPIKYYDSNTGLQTEYFSNTSVSGDANQVTVTVAPIQ